MFERFPIRWRRSHTNGGSSGPDYIDGRDFDPLNPMTAFGGHGYPAVMLTMTADRLEWDYFNVASQRAMLTLILSALPAMTEAAMQEARQEGRDGGGKNGSAGRG